MTREEEIKKAAQAYISGDTLSIQYLMHFENGAGWADEHPKNVWHTASEEPRYDENIIAIDIDGLSVAGIFEDYNGKGIYRYHCFLCEWDAVVKWAYVGEILPKGGIK